MGGVDDISFATFDRLMRRLEDWYSDDLRAVPPDPDKGSGSHEAGHRILRAHRYPGPPWRRLWDEAEFNGDTRAQAAIIRALEDEIYGLDHSPSKAGPASGLHRGTQEFRYAVANADGSLRAVARRFGVSHTEVRRLRLQYRGKT